MSLVVSLRVPDGIVAAADSLSTAQNLVQVELESSPGNPGAAGAASEIQVPPIPVLFPASSFTQKLIPLGRYWAVSSYGQGIINNKSTYYHLQQFEQDIGDGGTPEETAERLKDFFESELAKEHPGYRDEAPPDWKPIAFHVNGYEGEGEALQAVTYEVFVGRESEILRIESMGCTIGGEMAVVQQMWAMGEQDQRFQFQYGLMSLQDAVDLCEFYINTTAAFQRFTNHIPTVGGDVDVALITPFHGFQWLKRKSIMEVLDRGTQQNR